MMKRAIIASLTVLLMVLVSCTGGKKWTIKGEVAGVDGDTLYVKHLEDNQYKVVHKKALKGSGQFQFKLEKKPFAEFYFLQVNTSSHLVLVRDSSDVIRLQAQVGDFANASIEGSKVSQRIQACDKRLREMRQAYKVYKNASEEEQAATGADLLENFEKLKQYMGAEIYKDPKSLFAYYALYQRIDEQNMIFSPYANEDYNYFAAVATSYGIYREDDPRTKALHDVVLGALDIRRKAALRDMVDNAPEGIPEIVKKDVNGNERRLSDLKGKVVILNFWMSQSQESLVFNEHLKRLYMKYRRRGLTVFQVSSDQSKLLWTEAINSAELPWINVCDCSPEMDQHFVLYNVQGVPTTYLIGRDGTTIQRITSLDELEAAIKKAL